MIRLLALIFAIALCAPQTLADSPNIVLVLADDLGWSDPACYGNPIHRTPNLDRLAAEGMLFREGYAAAPICSASRAALLTGRSVPRLQFEFVTKNDPGHQRLDVAQLLETPPFTLNLPKGETSIAEALNELEYQTAFFGKWHLNRHYNRRYLAWDPEFGPTAQGFRVALEDFGDHPYAWGKQIPSPAEPNVIPEDSMISKAVSFLEEPHSSPFFLMVSAFHVHTPVRNRCRWLVQEYDERLPEDLPNRPRRLEYAAFVETLDEYVGRILQAIDSNGHADDTVVIFTSDNGGHPQYCANAPLRGSKWNLYEGGIRVPLIVRWPGTISPGTTCDQPVIGYDLLPTCVAIAGGKASDVDGINLCGLFTNPDLQLDRSLVWHFPYYHPEKNFTQVAPAIGVNDFVVSQTRPQSAIRHGNNKLLYFYEDDRAELYRLDQDPSEQTDLSSTRTDDVRKLRAMLDEHLTAVDARLPKRRHEGRNSIRP